MVIAILSQIAGTNEPVKNKPVQKLRCRRQPLTAAERASHPARSAWLGAAQCQRGDYRRLACIPRHGGILIVSLHVSVMHKYEVACGFHRP